MELFGLEHLFSNCHNELFFLLSILGALPFVGTWLRAKAAARWGAPEGHDHHDDDEESLEA